MAGQNNTSKIDTLAPTKGLVTDVMEAYADKETWSAARNAQVHSQNGQLQFIQNEPSNISCLNLQYTPIGFVRTTDDNWVVFSTNNSDSEIGVYDEKMCSYTVVVNSPCLNFSTKYLVDGKFRLSKTKTVEVYWTDGLNPRRFLDLTKVPYKYTFDDDACLSKKYTDELDCEELKVDRNISVPVVSVFQGINGTLRNGTYSFAIAYTDEKERITDYYSLTLPHKIWSHSNHGYSLELTIDGLDRDYDQFELLCVYTIDEATTQKRIGYYNTSTKRLTVSSIDKPDHISVNLDEVIIPRAKYPYADFIESNNEYLLWAGLRTYPELNYQLQAMKIRCNYTVSQLPVDYYKQGGQMAGYMRDEVYAFGIQWLYKNGEWSSVYHIPGRVSKPEDLKVSIGEDAYEGYQLPKQKVFAYEIENTAGVMKTAKVIPGSNVKGRGELGYWQSTELYPDNQELFGDDSCTPIRHPRMPDDCMVKRYSEDGKIINLIGVDFSNIEHPKDVNGEDIDYIAGYRIVRGDRDVGNRSILSKGFFTNVRQYTENGNTVKYANYPVNDLRPDSYLSQTPTYSKNGSERGYSALSDVSSNEFNYYSPETMFNRIQLGSTAQIYSQEYSTIQGYFEKVYNHPRAKLLTTFDVYFALIVGALDGYYATRGRKCTTVIGKTNQKIEIGSAVITTGGVGNEPSRLPLVVGSNAYKQEQACDDALKFTSSIDVDKKSLSVAERVLRTLAKAGVFVYFAMQTAQKVIEIIQESNPWEDYALQYNSHAKFTTTKCAKRGFKRREIKYYQYLSDGLNTVEDSTFNNYKREESVFIRLGKELEEFGLEDTSRSNITDFGICDNPYQPVVSAGSMYYGAIKRKVPNQYGALDSIVYLDTQEWNTNLRTNANGDKIYGSYSTFGGDTYITSFTVKRPQHMFSNFLMGDALGKKYPDGYIYDYSRYRNIGHPRFWINTETYDVSNVVSLKPNKARTPQNKYNLNCDASPGLLDFTTLVKSQYFYTTVNTVVDILVESTYNLDYRDYKGDYQNFYSSSNGNLSGLFRSDRSEDREEFVYDKTYFKQLQENSLIQQPLNFTQDLADVQSYIRNKAIYSMRNKWHIYLAANIVIFPLAQFGNLTAMKAVDNEKIMFLFDKSAPYITPGRDELQMDGSGRKITLGDGGLFSRPLIPIAYTDYYYANSESSRAFLNTQFGSFFISQNQGRIFQFTGQLNEITAAGNFYWFKNYLPSRIVELFPDYPHRDNTVDGVGMDIGIDNTCEVVYFTKRDYRPKIDGITYNKTLDRFQYNNAKIELTDPDYFEDISWTISYDPKQKAFISHHDWHPEWILQNGTHFSTVKSKGIWKHNQTCTSFCNFYDIDYPFEVEVIDSNGQTVTVLRSVEYFLEVGKYFSDCRDFHMILDDNFDYGVVSNNEQSSGLLKFNLQDKTQLTEFFNYPRYSATYEATEILYNKEEQKYRFNQFDDITKDRGEFSHKLFPIWSTKPNGYIKELVPQAHNYFKTVQFRKKMRNNWHKIRLTKSVCGDRKYVLKLLNMKQVLSNR